MKKITLFSLALSLTCVLCISCKKDKDEVLIQPLADNSLPSGAVAGVAVGTKTASSLEITVNIAVFRDSKNIETQLNADNFIVDTLRVSSLRYYFERGSVNMINGAQPSPYAALMLMDQSGSISGTDPKDYRLEAAKAFCNNLGTGDNIMLWSFAGTTLKKYGTGFTANGASVLPDIESLRGKEGGGTPLYKSQYSVTDFVSANTSSSNKAVMTFTDGEDTDGGYTSDQVALNAVAKNVRLFNVGLGAASVNSLNRQAVKSGGAFMFAKDARQLISMFGNLGKLLDKTAQYYRVTWKITRSTGNFGTGNISHLVRIKLPYGGDDVLVPFSFDY